MGYCVVLGGCFGKMASTENGVWGSDAGGSFFEMVEEGLMGFGLFLQIGRAHV